MLGKMPIGKAVSIHTPTKGVTTTSKVTDGNMQVSIHTPTKGVTKNTLYISTSSSGFNPHTHEGCDMALTYGYAPRYSVSIHTPTKGVTSCPSRYTQTASVSIHTPTKGVTQQSLKQDTYLNVSIHTPTKGVT